MHKYRLIAKKGEGTFSEVLKAQSIKNGKCLAIKCMKNHFDSIEQVNSLREIQALRRLSPNPHIVKMYEVLYDQPTGRLALVFELMDCNIYELIRGRRHRLPESLVKMYTYQLVKAMDHMHRNGIFHRDIKPENILIMDDLLKLADFGSCRGIYSKQPYTEYISTRWYRAPECLLTDGCYGYKMDMWGVGCVLFEILALIPLFPGTDEKDQIERIHAIIGTPPSEVLAKFQRYSSHIDYKFPPQKGCGIQSKLPHASPEAVDIIVKLLAYDPEDRISARQALRHPWFQELRAADKRQQHANGSRSQPTGRSSARTNGATGGSSSKSGTTKGSGAPSAAASTGAADGGDTGQGGGKSEEKQAEHSGTTGSDPGLPTIGKGGKSKRGNQNSSTIALPVPASSTGASNTKGRHGHHGHHHSHHNRRGPGTNSSALSGAFASSVPGSSAAPDASLPPIGKPLYGSTLRVGGVNKYHNKHYSKHSRTKGKDAKKSSKYSYPSRNGNKFQGSTYGRGMAGSVVSGKSAASGASGGSGSTANKYLSPYSQKFIKTQRHS